MMTPEEKQMLVQTANDVKQIKMALMGDELGSIGMAQRMVNNERQISIVKEKIENHEGKCDARNNKMRGVFWFVGVLWTAGTVLFGFYLALKV